MDTLNSNHKELKFLEYIMVKGGLENLTHTGQNEFKRDIGEKVSNLLNGLV